MMVKFQTAMLWCVLTCAGTTAMCLYIAASQQQFLQAQIAELSSITLGPKGPCTVSIPRNAWDELNNLKFYAWVVACEEQQP